MESEKESKKKSKKESENKFEIEFKKKFEMEFEIKLATDGGSPGTTINVRGEDPQTWITSPNATFSTGFSHLNPKSPLYSFSIWYTKMPNTVVWSAMSNDTGGFPIGLIKGDQLVFQTDGRLVLTSNAAGIIWGTSTSTLGVTKALLQENGNLQLLTSNGVPVWQSFDRPTDTILPDQQLIGNAQLVSNNQKYDLQMDGSRVALYSQGYWLEPYWTIKNDNQSNSAVSPPRLNFSTTGMLSFFDGNGSSWKNPDKVYDTAQRYALDYPKVGLTRRLTLDDDGNLRIYTLDEIKKRWIITWQAVLLECDIFGKCGRFGICAYRPTATCICPPGFHPTNASDPSQDCAYNTPLTKCPTGQNSTDPRNFKMIQLVRTDFQYNDYNSHPLPSPSSQEDCIQRCLRECECLGAAFQMGGAGICWLKGLDPSGLFNGKQSVDVDNVFFLKVSAKDPGQSPDANIYVTNANATVVPGFQWLVLHRSFFRDTPRVALFITTLVLMVFLLVTCFLGLSWIISTRARNNIMDLDFGSGPARFTYQQLQNFTDNFCDKLGSGGFGTVYKGRLPNGTLVAVKELEIAMQADKQFQAEVKTLGKIHHINLVRLLGYCYEDTRKLLVYEYMPNGSLDKLLFLDSWASRFNIALGIARGITYLHDECQECILHCDIKPQNILLDESFCPKVADFGLAKLMKRERALSVTTVRGTRGYLAPEWISNLPITTKVDVYSFGMVLLEIISGREKYLMTISAINSENNRWCLSDWAYNMYQAGDLESIVDKKLVQEEVNVVQFKRLLKVALWCIQHDANARPSMGKVVQMMEDIVQVPEPSSPNPSFEIALDPSMDPSGSLR
ncbi:G-type lectin S-receptor-like serine/threonine-protein kinase At1g34300 [Selaginella moellendorffii]|nr:G-type lectin S-receptor-like serine/threonine-protein kinase At1g34300 [Selaginella moellendorffii]|eukprot:XP_024543341.1 G-type lectin S-receptor-like serine/threonine-protein kinase At1g34300 [Selaginella moellendorffii]